jgi:protein TonB
MHSRHLFRSRADQPSSKRFSRQALLISLLLHGVVIGLIFALSATLASPYRIVVIDFTSVEPLVSPGTAASTPGPQKGSGGGGGGPNTARKPSRAVIPKPAALVTKKRHASMKTTHEPHGSVPIHAKPSELTAPPPERIPQSAQEGVNGGTGTGVGTGIGSGTGSGIGSGSGSGIGSGIGSGSGSGSGIGSGSGSGSGSGDGTAQSAELQRKKYLAEHFAYIRDIIEKNLVYPRLAQRNSWTGKTIVFFTVQKNGHVKDIRIMKSSGYNILDESVIETIRKVQPFPRPPTSVDVTIPLSFELK